MTPCSGDIIAHGRFDQPDPYDGSYDQTDPQSFNRYAYSGNDPVNFVDPTGLFCGPGTTPGEDGDCVEVHEDDGDDAPVDNSWGFDGWLIVDHEEPVGGGVALLGPGPNPNEVNRIKRSCLEILSRIPKDIYDAILNNKRDVQSPFLSLAHAAVESSDDPNAVGFNGELGLFQLQLSTANSLGLGTFTADELKDPALNTQLGTTHLQNLVNTFNGDVRTALGAYKQGATSVRQKGLSQESQEYADGILGCEHALQGDNR